MGVCAVVVDREGRHVRGLTAPAGGTFDAAGDFDRLLDRVPAAVIWSSIDPHADTVLTQAQAAALLRELPGVAELAEHGPERRGLTRLAILAALCESDVTVTLRFIGD
jgi:hypothetical protein